MKIRNIGHKGLRRLVEDDDASGLQPNTCDKLRKMVSFLQDMSDERELQTVASWKAHRLSGDRQGDRSLFVTKNWRLTFRVEHRELEIIDLDFVDYH